MGARRDDLGGSAASLRANILTDSANQNSIIFTPVAILPSSVLGSRQPTIAEAPPEEPEFTMQTKRNAIARLLGATLALSVSAATPVLAQDAASGMTVVIPGEKQWEKVRSMPYGMKGMTISGDPAKAGPYVYRVRVPSGYKWPPMKFPDERVTTVLKGILWVAEGERYDPMKMKELEAGAMFVTAANTAHYQWARTEVILQVLGNGPIDNPVSYINPDDDPRSQ